MPRSTLILLAALLVASGHVLVPERAAAEEPVAVTECGQVISTDAYLAHDLACTTEVGITALSQAEPRRIVLDLRGHTLEGPGAGTGVFAEYRYNSVGLRVTNGKLKRWGTGLAGHSDNSLAATGVVFSRNIVGFSCVINSCTNTDNLYHKNETGTVSSETYAVVRDNRFVRNKIGGLVAGFITTGEYTGNRFKRNKVGLQIGVWGNGLVRHNVFVSNRTGLLATDEESAGTFEYNVFIRNRDGAYVNPSDGSPFILGHNLVMRSRRYGFFAPNAQDRGGNIGWGNRRGCVGIVCHP